MVDRVALEAHAFVARYKPEVGHRLPVLTPRGDALKPRPGVSVTNDVQRPIRQGRGLGLLRDCHAQDAVSPVELSVSRLLEYRSVRPDKYHRRSIEQHPVADTIAIFGVHRIGQLDGFPTRRNHAADGHVARTTHLIHGCRLLSSSGVLQGSNRVTNSRHARHPQEFRPPTSRAYLAFVRS